MIKITSKIMIMSLLPPTELTCALSNRGPGGCITFCLVDTMG